MAKLTDFKNPLRAETVNVLSPTDWARSIGYVAFMGACIAIGAKALAKVDSVVPGNITPNAYKAAVAEKSTNTVTVY